MMDHNNLLEPQDAGGLQIFYDTHANRLSIAKLDEVAAATRQCTGAPSNLPTPPAVLL